MLQRLLVEMCLPMKRRLLRRFYPWEMPIIKADFSKAEQSESPKPKTLSFTSSCFVAKQVVCALRLRCIVDSKFSRWRRRSRNFAGYMLYFSIDTVLSLDSFSRFHKLIFV